jgi:hypothetical protein
MRRGTTEDVKRRSSSIIQREHLQERSKHARTHTHTHTHHMVALNDESAGFAVGDCGV